MEVTLNANPEIKKEEGVSGRTLRPPGTRCKMAETRPQALISPRSLNKRDVFDSIRAVQLCRTIEKIV